jgi:hypothetical protein
MSVVPVMTELPSLSSPSLARSRIFISTWTDELASSRKVFLNRKKQVFISSSFVDPQHVDAIPDTDPDPACHFDADADPDLDPTFQFDADPCRSGSEHDILRLKTGSVSCFFQAKLAIFINFKRVFIALKKLRIFFFTNI